MTVTRDQLRVLRQFSLRVLLVATLGIAVVFGVMRWHSQRIVKRWRHQQEILAQLQHRDLETISTEVSDRIVAIFTKSDNRPRTIQSMFFGLTYPLEDDLLRLVSSISTLQELEFYLGDSTSPGIGHLRSLAHLSALHVHFGELETTEIDEIAHLDNLKTLSVVMVSIADSDLLKWNRLSLLEVMTASETEITGTGFQAWTDMPYLRELYLANSPISDEGLSRIVRFRTLRVLDLAGTDITDDGLKHLQQLPAIQELILPEQIGDRGLQHLVGLSELTKLDLTNTRVTDRGLAELLKLPKLKMVRIGSCPNVGNAGIKCLADAPRIEFVDPKGRFHSKNNTSRSAGDREAE